MKLLEKKELFGMELEELEARKAILMDKFFNGNGNKLALKVLFDVIDVLGQKERLSFLEEIESL